MYLSQSVPKHRGTLTRRPRVHVFLSDEAYSVLVDQATSHLYIASGVRRTTKGFSNYVDAISRCKLQDTRPEDIQASDLTRLEAGYLPYWIKEYVRRARYIAMTSATEERLHTKALDLGITNHNRPDSADIPRSPISSLLEAIGINWLTPIDLPLNPHPPRTNRRR